MELNNKFSCINMIGELLLSKSVNKDSEEENATKKEMKKEIKIIIYAVFILIIVGIAIVTLYYGLSLIIVGMPVAVFGGLILPIGIISLIGSIFLIKTFIKDIKSEFKQKE